MSETCARGVLAALLWLLAGCACAADLWDRLGPARIGATREQLAAPMTCSAVEQTEVCALSADAIANFAGVPVRAVELRFLQEQLARVAVTLSERYYSALLSFLGGQFGMNRNQGYRIASGHLFQNSDQEANG